MERMYVHKDDLEKTDNQVKDTDVTQQSDINMDANNPAYTDRRYNSLKEPIDTQFIKTTDQKSHISHFLTGEVFDASRFFKSRQQISTADAKGGAGIVSIKLTGKKRANRKTSKPLGSVTNKIHSESFDPMSQYIW